TLTARLNVGVTVFFLISGFLLYRPFVAARAGRGPAPSWGKFWRRRGLRIVPAYWVALTALAIFPGLVGVFTGDWWIYYGFLQQWQRSTIINGIPPAWTLGTELCFYAMLPLYAALMVRLERRAPGGEIGVLAALSAGAIAF